jgi:hypothetical protein
MSREERQALLHEGVSVATTLSAYGAFDLTDIFAFLVLSQSKSYLTTPTTASQLAVKRSFYGER